MAEDNARRIIVFPENRVVNAAKSRWQENTRLPLDYAYLTLSEAKISLGGKPITMKVSEQ